MTASQRTGIVIQARMGSTRLAGKVLADLGGKPLLERQIERLRLVPGVGEIVVATSDSMKDEAVANLVSSLAGIRLWRGPEDDVLARFAGAAAAFDLDVIGRVTGDCPLIDPDVVGRVLAAFHAMPGCDYASNCRPRTWPGGFEVEVVSRRALDTAQAETRDPFDRQHVLVYIFTRPDRFECINVENDTDAFKNWRFTVDYSEDLELVRAIFARLQNTWPHFCFAELVSLLKAETHLLEINRAVPAHDSITDASQRHHHRAVSN